jgi:hypothetical protein
MSKFEDEEIKLQNIKSTIYHSLSEELPRLEEISTYDLKGIITRIFNKILDFRFDWADSSVYGKNKILLIFKNKPFILDMNPLIESLRTLHKDYIEPGTK